MIDDVLAIRRGVALSDRSWTAVVKARGEAAYDVLDRVLPCDLYLRDGQVRPTLLLGDDGSIVADVHVIADENDFLLAIEGPGADEVIALCESKRRHGEDARFEAVDAVGLGIDGPFAWELMAAFDTPGVVGLAYLSSYRPEPDVLAIRAGRTGEYGYDLLVGREAADKVRARLAELGTRFEARAVGAEALAYCALENFFFDVRRDARPDLTPIELQLQWRISRRKTFPGSAALADRRAGAPRVVAFRADEVPAPGTEVTADGVVGDVLRSAASLSGPGAIGLAVVAAHFAHPGHQGLSAGGVRLRTLSPPFVANRSLYVKPQQHSFAARDKIGFPA